MIEYMLVIPLFKKPRRRELINENYIMLTALLTLPNQLKVQGGGDVNGSKGEG